MKPPSRKINGILILDKVIGVSSNQALQEVKKIFTAKKAGHTGSLDVLASGLLPICFGEATKFSKYLLEADKTYRVMFQLGKRTTTCDSEGKFTEEKSVEHVTDSLLTEVLQQFLGEIEQIPSMYSALKHKGQPLYKLARKGIEVERKPRKITIHELKFLGRHGSQVGLEVSCSKGTYIRNLVDDIGQVLNCGAYVTMLRRLKAGPYNDSQMIEIKQLKELYNEGGFLALDKRIISIESIFSQFPMLNLSMEQARHLYCGRSVYLANSPLKIVKLITAPNRFIGLGSIDENGKVIIERLLKKD